MIRNILKSLFRRNRAKRFPTRELEAYLREFYVEPFRRDPNRFNFSGAMDLLEGRYTKYIPTKLKGLMKREEYDKLHKESL